MELMTNGTQEALVEKEMLSTVESTNIPAIIEALRAEHQRLEERLDELDAQVWLTPEEQIERKNCQKLKLAKKDRIYELSKMLS